jgi:DNA-binding CsgD family transcriptional regulator
MAAHSPDLSTPASEDPCAALTSREKELLRLVPEHPSSKAIARIVGIEHGSVTKTLNRAMAKLGVSNRHRAAAMLAAYESLSPNQDKPSPEDGLSPTPPLPPAAHSDMFAPSRPTDAGLWREVPIPFDWKPRIGWRDVPLRRSGGRTNDLSMMAAIGWSIGIPVACAAIIFIAAFAIAIVGFIWTGGFRPTH